MKLTIILIAMLIVIIAGCSSSSQEEYKDDLAYIDLEEVEPTPEIITEVEADPFEEQMIDEETTYTEKAMNDNEVSD